MPPMACSRTPNRMFRPAVSALKIGVALDVGEVRLGQVGGAAEQLRHACRQRLDRVLAGVARGDLGSGFVGLEIGVPAVGKVAGEPPPELGRPGGIGCGVGGHARVPLGHERLACRDRRSEVGGRLVRHVERAVRIPAVGLLGEADLVGTERRAVGLLRVLLVRAAESDVGPDGDEAGPVVRAGGLDRGRDRVEVVAVDDALGVPAVGGEARGDVLGPGHLRRSVELDEVVVVEDDELAEAQVPRQARGLGGDALLEVAVGRDDVGPVIDDRAVGPRG